MNRRFLRQSSLSIVLLSLLSLSGCGTYTAVRQHPDFASQNRSIETVALLPPEVEYVRKVFAGDDEPVPSKELSVARTLSNAVPSTFRRRGYQISKVEIDKALGDSEELRYELEQLRKAYTQASGQLYEKGTVLEEQSKQFDVNLGTVVNQFADACDADGLILVRYSGFEKSDGLVTKEVVSNAMLAALTGTYYEPVRSGGFIELALIDGNNGDVLWSNVEASTSTSYSLATKALKALPFRAGVDPDAVTENDPAAATETSQDYQPAPGTPDPAAAD